LKSSNTFRESGRARAPLVLLIVAALCGRAYAVDPNRAMPQYLRDRWGVEQGFPRGPVYAIGQSNDGYLWIGTRAGLVRFDGLNFRLMQDVPGMQSGERVLGLMTDGEGDLWIRLEGGLLRYRNGAFDRPKLNLPFNITALSQANNHELLISLMEHGTMAYHGGGLEMLADARELPRSPVLAIAQTADGSIWSGTRGAGLFRQKNGRTLLVADGLPDPKVNCLTVDPQRDSLWVGTDSGVVRWTGSRLKAVGPPAMRQMQILAMERDRDGNIWAGTDSRGVVRISDREIAWLDAPGERNLAAVTALFEDREGNLWIGSDGAIERLRDSAFVSYSRAEGLPANRSNPVFVDAEDRLWIPPVEGGLWWLKGGHRGRVSNDGLDRDEIYSIAGSRTELWLGRQRGGLTMLCAERDVFAARTYTTADGLAQDSVFSVYAARDGSVWAGTLSAGVSRLRDGKFTTYTTASGLLANTVASILETSDGTMWFGTPGGLSALANGRWQSYTQKEGLRSENIYCLLEDSGGVLWIGTAAGLAFRGSGGIRVAAGWPAILREPIMGIAEDRNGSLWIAESNHVLRVKRDKLLAGGLADGDLREFGTADGLHGVEGLRRYHSVSTDAHGRVWFALNGGIAMVDPTRLTRNSAPALVHVESITADGNPAPLAGAVHVPGGSRRVTFGFTGLSLAAPQLVRFRFRLDGYDSRWSEPGPAREAGYTNLGPRSYTFRVMASNPDGAWSGAEAAIPFQVDPLWWQTWWFRGGLVMAIGGAIMAYFRFRMRRLTSRLSLRFEERLAERTRIAQELHDTLLQGFISASMQVHVAAEGLPPDSAAKARLAGALQLMRQVTDEGRKAVRGLRSTLGVSLDLESAFSQIQQELSPQFNGESAAFRVIGKGQRKPLRPFMRDDIYRIGREALINAFRHARAKNIEIEVIYLPNQLRVLVRDDGCGIEPHILTSGRDGHWGLPGMKERAEQIGAHLHVYSSAAGGTEVELSVPGHVAFQGQTRRRWKWRKTGTNER
jgi:ligand-binding sensor domain-containing protein/signal transduction histidine kinase